jgi:hypothetical protein
VQAQAAANSTPAWQGSMLAQKTTAEAIHVAAETTYTLIFKTLHVTGQNINNGPHLQPESITRFRCLAAAAQLRSAYRAQRHRKKNWILSPECCNRNSTMLGCCSSNQLREIALIANAVGSRMKCKWLQFFSKTTKVAFSDPGRAKAPAQ